jgi:iron complex transport system substrate-binding protein
MRIVSLVPSATEMLYALGLGDEVIAVTHECDHPLDALALPRATRDVLDPSLPPAEIDAAVRERTLEGKAIYELDEGLLHELEPDLIVTQALCAVCAVSYDDVVKVAEKIDSRPKVISLDPHTLGEMLSDVRTICDATDTKDRGVDFIHDAAGRIDSVRISVRSVAERPRVVALEWLDPVYIAGHWTPQIIDYAGGIDVLGMPGEHSEVRAWEEVAAMRPEVVVVMPCGYDAPRAAEEASAFADQLRTLGAQRIVAVDAAAYFSRPGPRLLDGLELMASILHPGRFENAPGEAIAIHL